MAKVIYDPIFDSFSGKIGHFVYYKNRSARCVRRYVIPQNPRTLPQQRRRCRFADAVHLWQDLALYQKEQWNRKALVRHISGYNFFISEHIHSGSDAADDTSIPTSSSVIASKPLRSRSVGTPFMAQPPSYAGISGSGGNRGGGD